jgi:ribosomal protein S6
MEKDDNMTVYEVSYLLLPSLSLEQVKQSMALGNVFTANGGTIISGEEPVLIDLAYPMTKVVGTTRHKATQGYFGWVKFAMPKDSGKEGILSVKKVLDANDEVLRYLLIKTVRENTLLNGKMMLRKDTKSQDGGTPEEVVADPVDTEGEAAPVDLDKTIDDLVIA